MVSDLSGGSKFYHRQGYSVVATEGSASLGMLSAWACPEADVLLQCSRGYKL